MWKRSRITTVRNNPTYDERATAIKDRRNKAKRGYGLALMNTEPIKFNCQGEIHRGEPVYAIVATFLQRTNNIVYFFHVKMNYTRMTPLTNSLQVSLFAYNALIHKIRWFHRDFRLTLCVLKITRNERKLIEGKCNKYRVVVII